MIHNNVLRSTSHSGHPGPHLSASSKLASLRWPAMSIKAFKSVESGYTLLEMLTVLGIVAILGSIAIPSFKYVTTSNRIATEVNGLLGDMQYARSEAIKEGLSITVCQSTNGTNCTGSASWHGGWIVFTDSNGNGTVDAGEKVLRVQNAFAPGDTFVADIPAFTGATFNREGYAATHAAVNVTVKLHDLTSNTAWIRCLAVTPVGLMTTQKYSQGNCT